jgi:hypothetical protein
MPVEMAETSGAQWMELLQYKHVRVLEKLPRVMPQSQQDVKLQLFLVKTMAWWQELFTNLKKNEFIPVQFAFLQSIPYTNTTR